MPAGLLLICNGSQLSIQNLNAAPTFSRKSWQWGGECQFPIYKSHSRAIALLLSSQCIQIWNSGYWIANLHEYICTVLDFYRTKEALLQILNCSLKLKSGFRQMTQISISVLIKSQFDVVSLEISSPKEAEQVAHFPHRLLCLKPLDETKQCPLAGFQTIGWIKTKQIRITRLQRLQNWNQNF